MTSFIAKNTIIRTILQQASSKSTGIQFLIHHHQQQQQQQRTFNFLIPNPNSKPNISKFPSQFHSLRSYSTGSQNGCKSGSGFLNWYLEMLETRPFITKGVSCSLIFAAADVTSQAKQTYLIVLSGRSRYVTRTLDGFCFFGFSSMSSFRISLLLTAYRPSYSLIITLSPSEAYDKARTLRIAAYGLLIMGPSQHIWFNNLSRVFPGRDVVTSLKKIFSGQIVYGPIMNSIFFSYNAALQGETGEEIVARLKRDLFPTLRNGLLYWPMCDFLTFRFIPVHLQPLANSSFAYLWTIYLTYMASLKKVDD